MTRNTVIAATVGVLVGALVGSAATYWLSDQPRSEKLAEIHDRQSILLERAEQRHEEMLSQLDEGVEVAPDEIAEMIGGMLAGSESPEAGGQQQRPDPKPAGAVDDPTELIDTDRPIRGNEDADLIIVSWEDFLCPACQQFKPELDRALMEYQGEVGYQVRHFITQGDLSARFAVSGECVADNVSHDAFWDYHDAAYQAAQQGNDQPGAIARDLAEGEAQEAVESCIATGEPIERVQGDMDIGSSNGVQGTPYALVINRANGAVQELAGAAPAQQILQTLEAVDGAD